MSFIKFIQPTQLNFIDRKEVAPNVYTFSFKPMTELTWHAGQHAMIEIITANGKTARRMFSLSSAPSEGRASITTRFVGESASEFKKGLWALQPGSSAKLRGPVGPMYVREPSDTNVFVASGIGITPFRSMLIQAVNAGIDLHGVLLYENRSDSPIIFEQELDQIVAHLPNFEVAYVNEPNHIDESVIRTAIANKTNVRVNLAGSPKAVKHYKGILHAIGIKKSQIKNDPFYGYK